MNLRRALILADESADWVIAGLRQLDRLALSIDEFAVDNDEKGPVVVCILWQPDLDQSRRWIPVHPRLTHLAFTNAVDNQPYDVVLSTRLFLYRRAVGQLLESKPAPTGSPPSWESYFPSAQPVPAARPGAWEYIRNRSETDRVEAEFLRASGKSQDGLVSRYLNRPISRAVTRFLLRHPVTPNAWTWWLSPVPLIAALIMARGGYWSFVWGLVLFQVFSVLDGCDGEIARARFMESARGRQLDDLFDVLSNVVLALGLGVGLGRRMEAGGFYLAEGLATALLIVLNEWWLAKQEPAGLPTKTNSLGETLYPRHRQMIAGSGLLKLGEGFASALIQLTKRDVAVLFFVFLAVAGWPALILHLLFGVTAITLGFAVGGSRAPPRD